MSAEEEDTKGGNLSGSVKYGIRTRMRAATIRIVFA